MNVIRDVNRLKDGTSTVDPENARHALVMIVEPDPTIRLMKNVRDAGDLVEREVRVQIKALREEHKRNGRRTWDARPGCGRY